MPARHDPQHPDDRDPLAPAPPQDEQHDRREHDPGTGRHRPHEHPRGAPPTGPQQGPYPPQVRQPAPPPGLQGAAEPAQPQWPQQAAPRQDAAPPERRPSAPQRSFPSHQDPRPAQSGPEPPSFAPPPGPHAAQPPGQQQGAAPSGPRHGAPTGPQHPQQGPQQGSAFIDPVGPAQGPVQGTAQGGQQPPQSTPPHGRYPAPQNSGPQQAPPFVEPKHPAPGPAQGGPHRPQQGAQFPGQGTGPQQSSPLVEPKGPPHQGWHGGSQHSGPGYGGPQQAPAFAAPMGTEPPDQAAPRPTFARPEDGPAPTGPAHGGAHYADPAVGGRPPEWAAAEAGAAAGAGAAVRPPLWKRLHLPWIAGIVVLLPVALGGPWMLEKQQWQETGAIPPDPVPADGDAARISGSDWELVGVVLDDYMDTEPPPPGITLVDVGFRATPGDERSAELLKTCSFQAVGADGRIWETSNEYTDRPLPDGAVFPGFLGCSDAEGEPLKPGDTGGFVASFLVPEDAAESLSFRVEVDTGLGKKESDPPAPEAALFEDPDEEN
ncbi:hypothetical protein O4J56_01750 [Nocardiopsis sp. RSe5-2]|uniref:DUF4352 domain-containing protein n=1 Tax=Nocardiopsis endophytica TaxID=3018445 RepID=A0ABT4TXD6_9ACTN|nr:hypothetical protein [Nocardiopsis endophytica]MDA2809349.1 hypothetical protein [Nocardiopsis endophytica]